MWITTLIISLVLAAAFIVWRIGSAGQPDPDDNDPDRQHEVPGAHDRPPPLPD